MKNRIQLKKLSIPLFIVGSICTIYAINLIAGDESFTAKILGGISDSIRNLGPIKKAQQQYWDYLFAVKLFILSIVIGIIGGIANTINGIVIHKNTSKLSYASLALFITALIAWCIGLFYIGFNFEHFTQGIAVK